MEQRPTKKQKELLNFIDGFIKGSGYGPSYREIMRALDYRSVSTVATHVNGLIARGWLVKKDNSARTLEVMNPAKTHSEQSAGAAVSATEQEIRAKLAELKKDSDANMKDIVVLVRTLELLGYMPSSEVA